MMRDWRKELAWSLLVALVLLAMPYFQGREPSVTPWTALMIASPFIVFLGDRLYRHYRIRRLGGMPEARDEYRADVEVRLEEEQAFPAIKAVARRFATYSFHRNHIDLDLAVREWLELKHNNRTLSLRVDPRRASVVVSVRSPCQIALLECRQALEQLNSKNSVH